MTSYDHFTELVPASLKHTIPENRIHHALWNLAEIVKEENPDLYNAATAENASAESEKEMTDLISTKWKEVMEWHVKNGFISSADHPEEIRRADVPTDPEVNQKILALVRPEFTKRIPFFVRKHATGKTCELIAREFPDLYSSFRGTPTEEQTNQMSKLVNGIFEERMAKHNM